MSTPILMVKSAPPLFHHCQEVRRLNQRMMELQQARRQEVSDLETALEELRDKTESMEQKDAEREDLLAQVSLSNSVGVFL